MKKREIKVSIIFLSLVIFLILVHMYSKLIFEKASAFSINTPVSLSVQTGNSTKEISLWEIEKEGVFFLPAYADLANCSFVYDDAVIELCIEDKEMESGQNLRGFDINCEYAFSLVEKEGEKVIVELPIVFMQSKNLPAI